MRIHLCCSSRREGLLTNSLRYGYSASHARASASSSPRAILLRDRPSPIQRLPPAPTHRRRAPSTLPCTPTTARIPVPIISPPRCYQPRPASDILRQSASVRAAQAITHEPRATQRRRKSHSRALRTHTRQPTRSHAYRLRRRASVRFWTYDGRFWSWSDEVSWAQGERQGERTREGEGGAEYGDGAWSRSGGWRSFEWEEGAAAADGAGVAYAGRGTTADDGWFAASGRSVDEWTWAWVWCGSWGAAADDGESVDIAGACYGWRAEDEWMGWWSVCG